MTKKHKPRRRARALAGPALEGMEVEFDEKVSLFPVELEEVPELGAARRRADRGKRRTLH